MVKVRARVAFADLERLRDVAKREAAVDAQQEHLSLTLGQLEHRAAGEGLLLRALQRLGSGGRTLFALERAERSGVAPLRRVALLVHAEVERDAEQPRPKRNRLRLEALQRAVGSFEGLQKDALREVTRVFAGVGEAAGHAKDGLLVAANQLTEGPGVTRKKCAHEAIVGGLLRTTGNDSELWGRATHLAQWDTGATKTSKTEFQKSATVFEPSPPEEERMNHKAPPKSPQSSLPPPPARLESRSLLSTMLSDRGPLSTIHFLVHPGMVELQTEAEARGWNSRGFTTLSVAWLELRWTTDGWKTMHTVSSNDVPCPVVNGTFHLQGCPSETEVEFAVRVGLACHAPHDTAFARDVGELWLNNRGKNFKQTSR